MAKGLKELASVPKPQISTTLAKQIVNFGTAVQIIKGIDFASLTQLSAGLNALASVKNPEISPAVARHIEAIGNSVLTLKDIDFSIMPALADSLRSLDGIQNSNLGNIINQLKKVPEIATNIANSGISTFAENIRQLVEALAPLGTIAVSYTHLDYHYQVFQLFRHNAVKNYKRWKKIKQKNYTAKNHKVLSICFVRLAGTIPAVQQLKAYPAKPLRHLYDRPATRVRCV